MKFTVKKVIIPIYFTGISQIYICIKSASVSVHRAIRRNSENIEPWNIDGGILLYRLDILK